MITAAAYLTVGFVRWDFKWLKKLGTMWMITRLGLLILIGSSVFTDGVIIDSKVRSTTYHIEQVELSLTQLEPCLQIVDESPDRKLDWSLWRKYNTDISTLRSDTKEICFMANNMDNPFNQFSKLPDGFVLDK